MTIHGIDDNIWMTSREHLILHRRLRREGKCNVPPEELAKISANARTRWKKIMREELRVREELRSNENVIIDEQMIYVVEEFLHEYFERDCNVCVDKISVKELFDQYCDKNGYTKCSSVMFGRLMSQNDIISRHSMKKGKRKMVWKGIKISL